MTNGGRQRMVSNEDIDRRDWIMWAWWGPGAHRRRGSYDENDEEKASDKVLEYVQNVAPTTTYDKDEKSRCRYEEHQAQRRLSA